MREIKFRAWDKYHSKMITEENNDFQYGPSEYFLQKLFWIYEDSGILELNQWTGLKDKNGKEIYEGDIIKKTISNHSSLIGIFEIVWKRSGFYVYKGKLPISFGVKIARNSEVIGNIYEKNN